MDGFAQTLIAILTAADLDQAMQLALSTWMDLVHPRVAAVCLWDAELGRHIMGRMWGVDADMAAPALRRTILRWADSAWRQDAQASCALEPDVYCQSLSAQGHYAGAFVGIALAQQPEPSDERHAALSTSAGRALYLLWRLARAEQEHTESLADRTRLENLLKAVEQQQRTIDRLLAAERQASATLERVVEQRTADLRDAQHRLIQSEKLAVIGQLASSLAHELNNPLQAIQSGLGLMMDELEQGNSTQVAADLRVIMGELERVHSIFRQMLDFYRPSSFENVPLDLNAICESVRVLLRRRVQDARVLFHLDLAEQLPLCCGDRNQIKQVLLNLVLNALEAMPAGGGNVRLCTVSEGAEVSLVVSDDGVGIPEPARKRLFEPLFTTKTRGLGLGLAISREIVLRHNGRISVESATGVGTTFRVFLPVQEGCS